MFRNKISLKTKGYYFNCIFFFGMLVISTPGISMTLSNGKYCHLISERKEAFSKEDSSIVTAAQYDTIKKVNSEEIIKRLKEDNFLGGRTARWYYAWFIFKDYPWYKKLFGGGFDYLEMFGKKFGESTYDYPHNPFISAFLYSGIIGGGVYLWFIFIVFMYYIKYLKHHLFFFICFLVVFFFSFVSANTHFSVPIFTILSIIPFITRHLVEKEQKSSELNDF